MLFKNTKESNLILVTLNVGGSEQCICQNFLRYCWKWRNHVDLKYFNEYDQKVWEDLHPESILQIGDLDRIKFFSQNKQKNYETFKAEFQKWMILGKTQPTYQVFEENREKLCQEWTSLSRFIDQVHNHRLTKFQECI